jgi:formylglycine-generating enzyme required for sulfatase activity
MMNFICDNPDCEASETQRKIHLECHRYCGYCGSRLTDLSNLSNYRDERLILRGETKERYALEQENPNNAFSRRAEVRIASLTDSNPLIDSDAFSMDSTPTSWAIPLDEHLTQSKSQKAEVKIEVEVESQFLGGTLETQEEEDDDSGEKTTSPMSMGQPVRGKVQILFAYIPEGKYFMGSNTHEQSSQQTEQPRHEVQIKKTWMSSFPITQLQYYYVTGKNPNTFKSFNNPITNISFWDAMEFCEIYSANNERKYRLPTEAEWEYACRARTTTKYYTGDSLIPELACYNHEEHQYINSVGEYPPNQFGLYDMHGNVWEWCLDTWHRTYEGHPRDGSAWLSTDNDLKPRMIRGGSWSDPAEKCRSASRERLDPNVKADNVGFRIVCERAQP